MLALEFLLVLPLLHKGPGGLFTDHSAKPPLLYLQKAKCLEMLCTADVKHLVTRNSLLCVTCPTTVVVSTLETSQSWV